VQKTTTYAKQQQFNKPIETMSPGMSSSVITGRHFLLR